MFWISFALHEKQSLISLPIFCDPLPILQNRQKAFLTYQVYSPAQTGKLFFWFCGSVYFYTSLDMFLRSFTQLWLRVFFKWLLGKGLSNFLRLDGF